MLSLLTQTIERTQHVPDKRVAVACLVLGLVLLLLWMMPFWDREDEDRNG